MTDTPILLTPDEARRLRALAIEILSIVPDPGAAVHALHRGATLCGRGGVHPRLTDEPDAVTCQACRSMGESWLLWAHTRGSNFTEDDRHEP